MELREDDVIFCTVKKIEGTSVFLEVEGSTKQGTMMMSEVAAGRIRNIRNYVSLGRKIVCKVLRIYPDHIELSLRRVTAKEREQVLDAYKKERAFASILNSAGEKAEDIISKIKEENHIGEFLEEVREDSSGLSDFVGKDKAEKIAEMFAEKASKDKKVERKFVLRSDSPTGVSDIKEILSIEGADIYYLGSSTFYVSASAPDFREANSLIEEIFEKISERVKKKGAILEIKKSK